jgi:hypothetical protein
MNTTLKHTIKNTVAAIVMATAAVVPASAAMAEVLEGDGSADPTTETAHPVRSPRAEFSANERVILHAFDSPATQMKAGALVGSAGPVELAAIVEEVRGS